VDAAVRTAELRNDKQRLERDEGIEPSPRPWQGRVLPLYESRKKRIYIYSMPFRREQVLASASLPQLSKELGTRPPNPSRTIGAPQPRRNPQTNAPSLINFHDAGGFHHRRSPLPLGETRGSLAVDIDARKLLAVLVVDRYLPVTVLSAPVPPHAAGLAGTFRFRHSSSDGTSCQGLSQFRGGRASNNLRVNFRNMNYKMGATLYRHVRPILWMKLAK
jgi:hypothetical protein